MKSKLHKRSPVTSPLTKLTPNGIKLVGWLLPFIPLLFLAIDIAIFPVLIETSDPAEDATGVSLISKPYPVEYLGNYKAHRVYVSLDDIDDEEYLSFITKRLPDGEEDGQRFWGKSHHSNTALVLSIGPQGEGWSSQELMRILGKLASRSSEDHDGVIDLVRMASRSQTVLWYDFKGVSSTSTLVSSLPLDHLIIVKVQGQQGSSYSAEIRKMLEAASKKRLSALVLPCLASASSVENDPGLSCDATYDAFFQALEPGHSFKVFLSLDKNWSTEAIKHQVESIKETWKRTIKREDKSAGAMPTLYQSDIRLLLLFLPVCLAVCSLRLKLTLRNYVIICIAFIATGLEVQDKLAPVLYEVAESIPAWIFKCVLLAILSGGFLFFAGLDIEGIFRGHHGDPP
jgi:hypothetical protein